MMADANDKQTENPATKIRWDDSNAWIPSQCGVAGYLNGDVNRDCVVDLEDLDVLAYLWLLSTDPDSNAYIDCSDPANSDICK